MHKTRSSGQSQQIGKPNNLNVFNSLFFIKKTVITYESTNITWLLLDFD